MRTYGVCRDRSFCLPSGVVFAAIILGGRAPLALAEPPSAEPTAEMACTWWRDLRDYWTPIGWKDHPLRFNVLFNGSIIADHDPWGRLPMFKGLGAQ